MIYRTTLRLRPEPIKDRGAGSAYQAVPSSDIKAIPGLMESYHKPHYQQHPSVNPDGESLFPRHGIQYLPSVRPLMYGVLDIHRVCHGLTVLGVQILWITNSGLIGLRHLKELTQLTVYELGSILMLKPIPSNGGIGGAFVPSFIHLMYRY